MTPAPRDYGDAVAEWEALDQGAGLARLAKRRSIIVRGEDCREFLQGQLSNDIRGLDDSEGCAAAALSSQGRVIALIDLYRVGNCFEAVVDEAQLQRCVERLEQFLVAEDVELELAPAGHCLVVAGPSTAAVLGAAGLAPELVSTVASTGWRRAVAEIDGCPVVLRTCGDLRVVQVEIETPGEAEALWERLVASGASPVGTAARDVVRVESGRARYGSDVDENRIAIEARLQWAIDFDKGCYVGQEIIERAVSRGRLNHLLCLLALERDVLPGDRLEGGSERDVVTSVVRSPRFGDLALAYVDTARAETGSELFVASTSRRTRARVLPWPRADQ